MKPTLNSIEKRLSALEFGANTLAKSEADSMALSDAERFERVTALLQSTDPRHADARARVWELLAVARARRIPQKMKAEFIEVARPA
jgi:hypothetical protein